MNPPDTERRVRALAHAAALPQQFDTWPGVLARLPHVRRRRAAARAAAATAAVLAVGIAVAVAVPLAVGAPPSAEAAARRAAAVAGTGAGLPPFTLTEVTTTVPVGFQPEPPPPLITQHVDYADPAHWREESAITEPFGEGTQTITQIRNGPVIASVAPGRVTITRAAGLGQLPFASIVAWQRGVLPKLLAAASAGRCAPRVSLAGNGPLIDGRPTLVLRAGPSPCPSAAVPQANGPATFWLDKQTFLLLRAVLHGPGNQVAQTITVTQLHYHVRFPAGTFRLPAPSRTPPACRTVTSLPGLAALRGALAYPPLIPFRLPHRWHADAIEPGATASHCKITAFTITYEDAVGRPAVQLYEAPQSSPSVRFPGRAVTIHPGQTGTLNTSSAMAILWWIQDGRYCSLQTGGLTAGVRLTRVPEGVLAYIAASLRR
jgi:hypothetical protein